MLEVGVLGSQPTDGRGEQRAYALELGVQRVVLGLGLGVVLGIGLFLGLGGGLCLLRRLALRDELRLLLTERGERVGELLQIAVQHLQEKA